MNTIYKPKGAVADWSRTCEGCAHIVNEPGPKDTLWARCFALGLRQGFVVGNGRFLPYVPAWCPMMEQGMNYGTRK
jgi:hypothetical protein